LSSLGITANPEIVARARRLMALASLDSIRLIGTRATHLSSTRRPLWDAKRTPTLICGVEADKEENRFRITVSYAIQAARQEGAPDIQIDASFELLYSLPPNVDAQSDEVQAFANTNALLNSWPYWRELVQTTVARMNLPPLTIPLFRIGPTPEKKDLPSLEKQLGDEQPQSSRPRQLRGPKRSRKKDISN
jgi:hypothetical protein